MVAWDERTNGRTQVIWLKPFRLCSAPVFFGRGVRLRGMPWCAASPISQHVVVFSGAKFSRGVRQEYGQDAR